jgi:hypothetical protein
MHAVTRRHTLAAAIALALALAGAACSKSGDGAYASKAEMAAAPAADAAATAAEAEAVPVAGMVSRADASGGAQEVKGLENHNGSQLAYAHDVRVRMPAEKIDDNLGKVRDACNSQALGSCDVLGEQMSLTGTYPSGELRLRAAPAAVAGLVKLAAEGGTISERNTQAEDLAEAVRDNGLRRKRLEIQHAKLSEILEAGHGNMDQLVGITERLAMLEAELGAADQEAAQQQRRINTNQLSLHFEAENVSVASETSTRIGEAFRGLTATWDSIFAWMVTVLLGALLPLGLVFGAATWLALKLFRRPKTGSGT